MADGKYWITQAEMFPVVQLKNTEDTEKVQRILEKAKSGCLVTNSMKTEIVLNAAIS